MQGLRRLPGSARVRIARAEVMHIRALTRQIERLELELRALIKAHRPQLLAEAGCGPLTAAILIGRTAGAERFRSDASFARQAGVTPILCSSGQRDRHRLHRGGDRQLNHALHIIAITRARYDPATKAYLARKQAEGKANAKRSAASSATSRVTSTTSSPRTSSPDSTIPTTSAAPPHRCRA